MILKTFHLFRSIIFFSLMVSLPLLYSEDTSLVNQFSTSSYQFENLNVEEKNPVQVKLIAEQDAIKASTPFWVAVQFDLEDHWHLYWKNPGDSGLPITIDWQLPTGFKAENMQWPYPTKINQDSLIGFGYENKALLLVKITPPASLDKVDYAVKASIKYLVCSDSSCLPGEADVELAIPAKEDVQVNKENVEEFSKARDNLPKSALNSQIERKSGFLHVSLPAIESINHRIVSAYFAPEKGQSIDIHLEAKVDEKSFSVALKEKEKMETLKGVLVLNLTSEKGQQVKTAIEIDSVVNDSFTDVAYADTASSKGLDIPLPQDEENISFLTALFFAFLGGMILNLMPCVLPVISFKILSFVKMAREDRATTFKHGLAFSAGVMLSFWTLSAVFLGMQAYGHAVGWGFQLQEPLFVAILAAILFVFALSMFGLFEMGTKMGAMAGQMEYQGKKEGYFGSLFSGVLATLIATPCTGPFLGTVIGLAMTLAFYQSFMIFSFLGLGMAFPYLVLSAYPKLMRFLPKPGNWMVLFKQLMGFLMLASVLWLVWVFGAQTNSTALTTLLAGFFVISFACWIFGQWCGPGSKKMTKWLAGFVCFLLLITSFFVIQEASAVGSLATNQEIAVADDVWEEFSLERIKELQAEGKPVLVDFTAKWCLICQANHMVLDGQEVSNQLDAKGVVRMKADWTKKDPVITAELKKFGRNSVPLYVLYEGEKSTILPQVLTPSVVMDYL